MAWKFALWELMSGARIGEVTNPAERNCGLRLDGLGVGGITLRLDDPLAEEITSRDGDVLLAVYDGSTLEFIGDLAQAVEAHKFWTRTISRETLVNVGYSLGTDTRIANDPASIATRGMFEEVEPSDIADSGLRQALVDEAVRVKSEPRVRITFDPNGGGPDEPTLACNFASPLWRLQKRFCVITPSGAIGPDPSAVSFASIDRAQIAKALLDNANAIKDTGIRDGTFATLYPSPAGPYSYKPLSEFLTDQSRASIYFIEPNPATWIGGDNFTFSGSLNTRVSPDPAGAGPWNDVGGLDSGGTQNSGFSSYGGTAIQRTQLHDRDLNSGAHAFTTTTYGTVLVQVDAGISIGPYNGRMGVTARVSNPGGAYGRPGNYIAALMEPTSPSKLIVLKSVSGTVTVLKTVSPWPLAAQFYTIRLQVDTAGGYSVWFFDPGGTPVAPVISETDSDLATGGPLASGATGIYDVNIDSLPANTRLFDTWKIANLTGTNAGLQGFDFELVPSEPTVDGSGTKIATLNVTDFLGSDKPNAIFEFGAGNRRQPTFGTDYGVGDNVIGRATFNGVTKFNAQFRVYGVDIEIDKEGTETIKPILDPDTQ